MGSDQNSSLGHVQATLRDARTGLWGGHSYGLTRPPFSGCTEKPQATIMSTHHTELQNWGYVTQALLETISPPISEPGLYQGQCRP